MALAVPDSRAARPDRLLLACQDGGHTRIPRAGTISRKKAARERTPERTADRVLETAATTGRPGRGTECGQLRAACLYADLHAEAVGHECEHVIAGAADRHAGYDDIPALRGHVFRSGRPQERVVVFPDRALCRRGTYVSSHDAWHRWCADRFCGIGSAVRTSVSEHLGDVSGNVPHSGPLRRHGDRL